jgi:flagellar biosynthesis protein FliR
VALDAELLRLFLVSARVLPSAIALSVLSRGLVPRAIAGSLALALTVALAPLAGPLGAQQSSATVLTSLVRELAIGGSFALALGLALLASAWAVQLSHPRDTTSAIVRPLATVYALSAIWLVLALGGLRAFTIGLAESFRDAPLAGGSLDLRAFALGVVQLASDALAAAFGFALPLVASSWLLEASLALLSRVLPANAVAAAAPVRSLLLVLAGALLLLPIAAHAPELVRGGIGAARVLTRAFAR